MASDQVYELLADQFDLDEVLRNLTRAEYYGDENLSSAWANLVQWARQDLINDGSLDRHAPRGIWRLTSKGIEQARDLLDIKELASVPLKQLIERRVLKEEPS